MINFLVIDGAQDKINFFSYYNCNSYIKSFEASKKNNDIFPMLLFDFLVKNNIKLSKLRHLFVNQGPGKFSGIRTSIAIAKALSIKNKLNICGFNTSHLKNMNYMSLLELYESGILTKNLIKMVY